MHNVLNIGSMHAESFANDPKHLGFVLARYKFVARMLVGRSQVLEVGCGDGTGGRIVADAVGYLHGIDIDSRIIAATPFPSTQHDVLVEGGFYGNRGGWDAVYALDVLEHIAPEQEDEFLDVIQSGLRGPCIIGTPSRESQLHASDLSLRHHVNCKTEDELRKTLSRHFDNVFMFGMNDETLHTGFGPMCHYRLAVCIGRR
jgi:2-polyprenyl-3-methyl-5-hydroxy-6-metoxy-1,4-benzoquinol methylase